MQLNDLRPAEGSRKNRKRIGRGNSSGHGTTAGRGTKGQLSRSGGGKGNVGLGMGKSAEVPLAIQKGVEDAKKNMFKVPVTEHGTIPHAVEGHYGAGHVLIKPAIEGTGVIAGGPVRPLFELAGITNVLSKSLGTSNAMNIIKAAAEGLKELSSPAETAERRGLTVGEMFVGKEN